MNARRRASFLGTCLLLAGCAPSRPPVHHATLANGIRVVLCPDDSAPVLSMKLSFRVTWRDEPPGQEGLRFLSLMAVVNRKRNAHETERLGGWWDPTNHYPEVRAQDIVIHARDLEAGVAVFKDMLEATAPGSPRPAEHFRLERDSILKYLRKERAPSSLDRAGFEEPFALNDPVGIREALTGIDEEAFLDFFRRHMVPARAQVTLVGDFAPAGALGLLERELGGIPNPPQAVRDPEVFRRFRPGLRPLEGAAPGLRLAFPVPAETPSIVLRPLLILLKNHLQAVSELKDCEMAADFRPGQRLLKLAFSRDPGALKPLLDRRLADFPDSITEEGAAGAVAAALRQSAFGPPARLNNAYWMSWAVCFDSEPLNWNWDTPWENLSRLSRCDARTLRDAAREILDEGRRLVLQSGLPADAARTGGVIVHPLPPPFPDDPPCDTPADLSFRSGAVRRLDGGRILFLRTPARTWYGLSGVYPLGTLERRTRAYAARLEAAHPEGTLAEKTLVLDRQGDRLLFHLKTPCWTGEELMAWAGRIRAWLAQPPTEEPGDCAAADIPELDHEAIGEAPAWTFLVTGPREVPALSSLRLPGAAWRGPLPVRRIAPDPKPSAEEPFRVLVPLTSGADPERRAAAICLARWMHPETRSEQRYGPFTLDLPALAHAPEEAVILRVGTEAFLVLRFKGKADPGILEWIRRGAGATALDDEAMGNLRAHALAALMDRFANSPGGGLWAEIQAPLEGGADAREYDRVWDAVRALTGGRFGELAAAWLDKAEDGGR